MSSFLQQCAEKIFGKHGSNMGHVLVLMPNRRSSVYFRNALQQLAKSTILSPEIDTLESFMLKQSQLVQVEEVELIAELYNSHKLIGGELTFDDFIGTARVMLEDFERLDLQMADEHLFFKNLELLQSMKMWEPGEEPDEYKMLYRKFWEDFGKLYRELRKSLFSKGKGYTGMILRAVAEKPANVNLDGFTNVYFIGFGGLNKVDEVVVQYLQQKVNAEVLWDVDRYYVNDDLNEAGAYFRKYRPLFGLADNDMVNEIATAPKDIKVVGVAKNIGQVKVADDILQNHLKVDEATAANTVLILPDEKLLHPLVANLPSNIPAVNISMGLNIGGTRPATFFEVLFRLYKNSSGYRSNTGEQRFYYRDVFELLQHRFFTLLFGEKPVEAFINRMKEQNRVAIRKQELVSNMGNELYALLFEGENVKGYADYILNVAELVLGKLIEVVRAKDDSFAPDAEVAFRLRNIVSNSNVLLSEGELSIKTYIAFLQEQIRNGHVSLEGEPVRGLQIMGLYETRSLDFKNVIILSANEGILPGSKFLRSYVPFELQREFLTTYKDRDSIVAYLFYRLFQKAENVFILYNTEPDELGGGEKSRFILQLEHELKLKNKSANISDMVFAVDPPAALAEQLFTVPKTPEVISKIKNLVVDYGMSPSALNTYINCSLQYYFRYIAGMREKDDMEESMEASTIGDAVHHALQKIYEHRLNKAIDVDFLRQQLADKMRIEHLVREKLLERFDNESLSRGKNLLLFKVCIKLTEEFLKFEMEHLQQYSDAGVDLNIEMLEGELMHKLKVGALDIIIRGRVDRIERVGEMVQIADYKTSTQSTIPILNEDTWEGLMKDPKYSKSVQLLIYAWLYYRSSGKQDINIRSGIYWLRQASKELNTLRKDKTNDVLDKEVILMFEQKLIGALTELTNAEIPFAKAEDEKRCQYCEFVRICNRD